MGGKSFSIRITPAEPAASQKSLCKLRILPILHYKTDTNMSTSRYCTPCQFAFLILLVLMACGDQKADEVKEQSGEALSSIVAVANSLTDAERADGWQLLFNGQDLDGWKGLGRDDIPGEHWEIESGMIHKIKSDDVPVQADGQPLQGGDIMTNEVFGNYEFSFEWKISEAGNSGIKYNVSEEMSTSRPPAHAALGFEYQVLDDNAHPDAKNGPTRIAGALYDMIPPSEDRSIKKVGDWNQGRIVFNGNHGEHWLNGKKVVEYDLGTEEFEKLLAASKYAPIEGFADRRVGNIVLQDHQDDVWYRNLKIREL